MRISVASCVFKYIAAGIKEAIVGVSSSIKGANLRQINSSLNVNVFLFI